jgi:lipid-binding SYLF domain-containing protein
LELAKEIFNQINIDVMKNSRFFQLTSFTLLYFLLLMSSGVFSQSDSNNKRIINDSRLAKNEFIKADKLMSSLFNNAYAYVIFPNVGKGGLGVGGAFGNGAVFQRGKVIGTAKLSQLTVGIQAGGQAYREVIFFESAKDLIRFKENKIEFSAQASAVAATEGASGNAKYVDGVMIFSQTKGGLMYEASLGGQTFKFRNL